MGYIEYCIEYDDGEFWSETRPFWDIEDYTRITSNEYLAAIATAYKAKQVVIVAVRMETLEFKLEDAI